jgi:glycosyltransferase involved in cell wall biosynthesis
LPQEAFVLHPRSFHEETSEVKLIAVGAMDQLYKAQDVLINAVAACVQIGRDLKLVFVGDGQYRQKLESQAASLGLGGRVIFRGQLTAGSPVREQLDRADLFVLPSHQEGLPRAMIEAMARAMPCLGSTAGGIPELLPAEDVDALASKISQIATDPERMTRMSERNLAKAKQYKEEILRQRRIQFYRYVRDRTGVWLQARQLDNNLSL